jgi:hypothetical protein
MTVTGSGFSVPETAPKKPRNPRKAATAKAASRMLEALDFISHAADTTSNDSWKHHVRFSNFWAIASDGIMRAGHPIEEDLTLCPHLGHLGAALAKSGASLSLSALDGDRLSVAGGKSRFVVPCAPGEGLPPVMMDQIIAPITDKIKDGFKAVLALAKDDAERLIEASLLLRANTVVGCNGNLVLEYWHGVDLPPGLNIPQKFAKAVAKVAKPLIGFGWTEGRSVTFHFEGGAWMATQLMPGQWPGDIDDVLNANHSLEACPANLFEGLDAVTSFSSDGAVHFHEDKLKSTYGNASGGAVYGATFDVEGLAAGSSFTARLLKLAQSAAVDIDYKTHDDRMIMYNQAGWLRGVLMKRIS